MKTLLQCRCLVAGLVFGCAASAFATNASIRNPNSDLAVPGNWSNWDSMVATDGGALVNASGHYTLSADIEVNGFIADATGTRFYLDMNDGRTVTAKGYNRHAFGTNKASDSQFWITGGTFLVPETYFKAASDNFAIVTPQRNHDTVNNGSGVIMGVYNRAGDPNRTVNVKMMVPEIRVGYGTDNWFVASNHAEVTVGRLNIGFYPRGVGNGVVIDSGAVVTITNMTALSIGDSSASASNTLQISNGGSLTGVDRLWFSGGIGNTFRLSGSATDLTLPCSGDKTYIRGVGNTFEILDGAHYTMGAPGTANGRMWIGCAADQNYNTLRIAGAGSLLTAPGGNFLVGQNCSTSNGLVIADGGTFKCARLQIGYGGTAAKPAFGTYLKMTNGAVLTNMSDYVCVGYGNDGDKLPHVSDSRADISDSTVYCPNFYISHNTGAVNSAVCLVRSAIKASGTVNICNNGRGGLLDLRDGSAVTCANFYAGHVTSQEPTAVWAGSGATVRVKDSTIDATGNFIFYGTNTTLVVDNGQIVANDVQLPFYYNPDHDCRIEIRGRNAKIRGKGAYVNGGFRLGFRRDTRITFVIPANGYAEAPLQADEARINFSMNAEAGDTPVVFDFSESGDTAFETLLVQAKGANAEIATSEKVKNKMREALAAALPENKTAKLSFSKTEIRLTYGPKKGLALTIR